MTCIVHKNRISTTLFSGFFSVICILSPLEASHEKNNNTAPLQTKHVTKKKSHKETQVFPGRYEFVAFYKLIEPSNNTECIVQAATGAYTQIFGAKKNDPISPGIFSSRIKVISSKNKEIITVKALQDGSFSTCNFPHLSEKDWKSPLESFGKYLCKKFIHLDKVIRKKTIYKNIGENNTQVTIVPLSHPHFKASYQIKITSTPSKNSSRHKALFVHIDTFLKQNRKGTHVLVSELRFHSKQGVCPHTPYAKITYAHTGHRSLKILQKDCKLHRRWRNRMKKLAKKNGHRYWLFFKVHTQFVQGQ